MTPVKRLIKEGYIETTGQMTTASSPSRAGSPTREYRPGFRFNKATDTKPKGHHILVITDQIAGDGERTDGATIFRGLISKKAWGVSPVTASRSNLIAGDSLLFYLGGKQQTFLGTAIAASSPYFDKSGQLEKLFGGDDNYRIDLKDIQVWSTPKPIKPLIKKLSFITNTEYWGSSLQTGIRKIDKADYELILASEDYTTQQQTRTLDLAEFLAGADLSRFNFEPHSLPAPERIRLRELMDNVSSTRWQIPNFQRYFDWKKEDIRDLLESIFKDYYVGALLLWKTEREAPLDLMPVQGVPAAVSSAEYIVLDGQQRMTALYYAVFAPKIGLGRRDDAVFFYLDFRKFIEQETTEDVVLILDKELPEEATYERMLFPFSRMRNYDEWINGLEDYLLDQETPVASDKVRALRRVLEKRLKHIWEVFEIPYVVLPTTMGLQQVADIFEKINTKGKRLDTFDLLIARLLKYGVQLRKLWDAVLNNNADILRYFKKLPKINIYIFQTISLLNHAASSAKKQDVLNIYESLRLSDAAEFTGLWNESVRAVEDAIQMLENLREGFGVNKETDMPYTPMLPVLAALLHVAASKSDKAACYGKIRQWYWSAVFTNAYSSAAESQMTADYTDVILWFNDDSQLPRVVQDARRDMATLGLKQVDSGSDAVFKGVFSLLALKGAKDFEKNLPLEFSRDNEKDHLFPKAASSGFSKSPHVWSILNMTWLSDATNGRKTNKKPSEYIAEFIKEKYGGNEDAFKKVLESHYIDDAAYGCLIADDLDGFLAARERSIKRVIKQLVGIEDGIDDAIESDANQVLTDLEDGVREYLHTRLTAIGGEDYWDKLITPGIKERVKEKIARRIKRHPATANEKLNGLDLLSFCDVMDYCEIIVANWGTFEAELGSKKEVEKHFLHVNDYRNAIKHVRTMTNVERKQGEASVEWLYTTLRIKMR